MLNRKAFLLTGIVCLVISGLVLAYDVPNPNFNNDDMVDFADFSILANNWLQSGDGLAGDFDDSNTVDVNDLMVFCWYWLTEYSEYQQCEPADLDNDGIIAFEDMAIFAQNWLMTGEGLAGDFDTSNSVDCNDLSLLTDCWLKGTRPEETIDSLKDALAAGNIDKAVSYFADISKEKYRVFFQELETYLPQMASEMGELVLIEKNEEMAYYDLLRKEDVLPCAYPVIFVKEEDGSWKIYDF